MSESEQVIFEVDKRYSLWLPPNKGSLKPRSAGIWRCTETETEGDRHKFACTGATCVYYSTNLDMTLTHEATAGDTPPGCTGCENGDTDDAND